MHIYKSYMLLFLYILYIIKGKKKKKLVTRMAWRHTDSWRAELGMWF